MRIARWTGAALASALFLLAAGAPALAADDASQASSKTAATYQQLMREYQSASQAFSEAYGAATTDEQRQKIIKDKYPDASKYAPRFLAFAEKNPDAPDAVDALAWVVSTTAGEGEGQKALKQLTERYLESDKLGEVCQRLGYTASAAAGEALNKILEASPHRAVKAAACYALGQYHMNRSESAEAEKRFEEVIESYADVKSYRGTLGEAAKAQLFEARNLVVGKVAPEIEGKDVDDKTFKLSEYRGKVVVLDFWGDW